MRTSMQLAGENLLRVLDSRQNYLPYRMVDVNSRYQGWFQFFQPGHNVGRWWDAMLRLEAATGFQISADIEGAMLENMHLYFDNTDNLLLFPLECEWLSSTAARSYLEFHSQREGLLALTALTRYRGSRWAAEKGHGMLETIRRISRADASDWDLERLERYRYIKTHSLPGYRRCSTASIQHVGRFIEALVLFHEATGDGVALELADRFARFHLEHTTCADGELNTEYRPNHAHSYLGTLRGLLLFGGLTNQRRYIDRIAATYATTVRKLVRESGYTCHDMDKETAGDPAAAGDAAQIALWLAHHGYTEFLDDVERIVRSRLIPSQIRQSRLLSRQELKRTADGTSYLYYNPVLREYQKAPVGSESYQEDLHEKLIGAYGGIHYEHHGGKQATTDVTASVLHSLCDIYRNVVSDRQGGIAVNFHFDYEDDGIRVTAERGREAKISIVAKIRRTLYIRIPGWVPSGSPSIAVNGKEIPQLMIGGFACVPERHLPSAIELRYPLPIRTTTENIDGVEYEYTWKGDEIIGVYPNTDFFPFYATAG